MIMEAAAADPRAVLRGLRLTARRALRQRVPVWGRLVHVAELMEPWCWNAR